MENRMYKIFSSYNRKIALKVYEGHFATPHSHITHYFDMSTLRTRASEAEAVAEVLSGKYEMTTIVDTIVCIDGTEVIGAYLAKCLTSAGIMSMNAHETVYVVSPELNMNGQLMFRENMVPMIRNKNILILTASVTTGESLEACVDSVKYYGGILQGIGAIFSALRKVAGVEIHTVFTASQLPEYKSCSSRDCSLCRSGKRLDAIVNGYGYSSL